MIGIENMIDGAWRAPRAGATEEILDPATGEPIARVADVGRATTSTTAVAAAEPRLPRLVADHAGRARARPPADRRRASRPRARSSSQRRVGERRQADRRRCARRSPSWSTTCASSPAPPAASRAGRPASTLTGYTSMIRREPVGVVGQIAPWNYPLMMAIWKIGPALAAGNTVVLKPSEQTPMTAARLAEIAAEHLPPGVLNVVFGHGEAAGAALVRHPKVAMVSLTGDVATGREVARGGVGARSSASTSSWAARRPVLVFDDADLDAVVEGIKVAGFWNAGQDCTAAAGCSPGRRSTTTWSAAWAPPPPAWWSAIPRRRTPRWARWSPPSSARRVAGFLDRRAGRRRDGERRRGPAGGRLRLRADGASPGWRQARRARPARGLRAGGHRPALRLRRGGDRLGQRRRLRPRRERVDARRDPGDERRAAACASARSGSTTTSPWPREMPHGGFKQSGYGKDISGYSLEDYTVVKHVMVSLG